jgi:FkbM family methyltransferase
MKKLKKQFRLMRRLYKEFNIEGLRFFAEIHLSKKDLLSIQIPGLPQPIYLRRNGSDLTVFEDIFLKFEYHFKHLQTPETIMDAGANIGLAVVFFKRKFPNAKVIAIEPESSNFELLKKNTEMYKDVILVKKGLWHQSTWLDIVDAGLGNWGFIVKETNNPTSNSVEATSINDLLHENQWNNIDLLKVDIESSEVELLQHNYENWIPKTKTLLIELHDRMRPGCSKAVFNTLVKYDFSLDHVGENVICNFIHPR